MSASVPVTPARGLVGRVHSVLSRIDAVLVWLAETGPRAQAIRKLNGESDEALAARGTTRVAEVDRIFSGRIT